MDAMIARVFLMSQLSPGGLEKFRDYEKSAMIPFPARYLQGSEIAKGMKNPPKNPTETEVSWMQNLWENYRRNELRSSVEFEEQHSEVVARTKLEEIYAWENYAMRQYVKWLGQPFEPQQLSN